MAQVEYVPDFGALSDALLAGPLADPLSIAMVAVGSVLLAVSMAVFGGLSLGGVVSLVVRAARE